MKAKSENTLKIDMGLHSVWHELNDIREYTLKVRLPQFRSQDSIPSREELNKSTDITVSVCERNYKRFAALDDYIREILYTSWLPRKNEISFDKWLLNDWDDTTGKFRLE